MLVNLKKNQSNQVLVNYFFNLIFYYCSVMYSLLALTSTKGALSFLIDHCSRWAYCLLPTIISNTVDVPLHFIFWNIMRTLFLWSFSIVWFWVNSIRQKLTSLTHKIVFNKSSPGATICTNKWTLNEAYYWAKYKVKFWNFQYYSKWFWLFHVI